MGWRRYLRARTAAFLALTMCGFALQAQAAGPSRPEGIDDAGWASLQDAVRGSILQEAKLSPDASGDGAADDRFGWSVAVSGDTAIVGARGDDIGANGSQGSAYVFTRVGSAWAPQAKLIAGDGAAGDAFGLSVALSGDTAIIGARGDDGGANTDQGSAYVFTRSGTSWTQQAKLVATDGASNDEFGHAVGLSENTAIVGSRLDDIGGNTNQGSAYVFIRTGTTWTEQAKLTAGDGATGDFFGSSVALSGDTAIVGASLDDIGGNSNQGSAYVFTRTGTNWAQQAQLTADDGAAGDQFGTAAAFAVDTAIVGANTDRIGSNNNQGSAYVFARSGTSWTQQAKLTAGDGAVGDLFGTSVAVSGDMAIVGAPGDDIGTNLDQGSAYVYIRTGTTWSEQAKLIASDGAGLDGFGWFVALSGDTAIIGAYLDDIGTNLDQGSAYVFTRTGSTWALQAQLGTGDSAADEQFGWSVALSGDTAIVGARLDDISSADQGSAYVFTRTGTTWSRQAKLVADDGATGDEFGWSVALSGDTALVSAWGDDIGANTRQGSAYVFTRTGTTWTQQAKLTADDGAAIDDFGWSVALSGDTAIVGAYGGNVGFNNDQGAAYVFTRSGTTWTQQAKLTAGDGAISDQFGISVALSGDTAIVGAWFDDIVANTDQGSAYIFTRTGTIWTQQAKLTAADGAGNDLFGSSVGLSGDTAIVGARLDDIGANANQGSAYVYTRTGTDWSQQAQLIAEDGAANDQFGWSAVLSRNTAIIGALFDDVGGNTDQGSAYVFSRTGTAWTQQARLTAADGAAGDQFGRSVALSGDNAIVSAADHDGLPPFGSPNEGAAYVFSGLAPIDPTTTTITDDSPDPSALGATVSVLVSVVGSERQPLDGQVVITASTGETCSDGTPSTGAGNTALFSCTLTFASTGARNLVAAYSGSSTHEPSTSSAEPHAVTATVTVSPAALAGGTVDLAYAQTLTATGEGSTAPYTFAVSTGTLPAGLTLAASGALTGTPTAAGTRNFTVTATDSSGVGVGGPFFGSRAYEITIARANQATLSATATPSTIPLTGSSTLGTTGGSGTGAVSYAVTAGGSACSVAGNALTGTGVGSCTVSATKAADANYNATTATVDVEVLAATDLEISKTDGSPYAIPGSFVEYEILVGNAGPLPVLAARVEDPVPSGLNRALWTCTPVQGATCPAASGIGGIDQLVDLPVDGVLRYVFSASVSAPLGAIITNTATIAVPTGIVETDASDNSASDVNSVVSDGVFVDGFETPAQRLSVLIEE